MAGVEENGQIVLTNGLDLSAVLMLDARGVRVGALPLR